MTMSIYARDQLISFQDLGLGAAASTWVFMISIAVIPAPARCGKRSIAARNVPSRVKQPICSSEMTASSQGLPRQEEVCHRYDA